MKLFELIARRHGVGESEARSILWKRSLNRRARFSVACVGGLFPDQRRGLRAMMRDVGNAESYGAVEDEVVIFKRRRFQTTGMLTSRLFDFRARRVLNVAGDYFGGTGGTQRDPAHFVEVKEGSPEAGDGCFAGKRSWD